MLCIPPEFSDFYIYERKGEKMKKAAPKKSGTAVKILIQAEQKLNRSFLSMKNVLSF